MLISWEFGANGCFFPFKFPNKRDKGRVRVLRWSEGERERVFLFRSKVERESKQPASH